MTSYGKNPTVTPTFTNHITDENSAFIEKLKMIKKSDIKIKGIKIIYSVVGWELGCGCEGKNALSGM